MNPKTHSFGCFSSTEKLRSLSMKPIETYNDFGGYDDRITTLHETIVSHILSRLPSTKDVVRTSVLSKDWRYKWTSAYNIDIDDNYYDRVPFAKETFVKFMHKILFFSRSIRAFRLVCGDIYGSSLIHTWILTALIHSLESLEVESCVTGIVLPCTLLNSSSLKKLTLLFWGCTFNVHTVICAPNLTSLYLSGVYVVNGDHGMGSAVKFKFPLLETFRVEDCKWLNVKYVEIYAPSLTTFTSAPSDCDVEDYDYSFVIHAPKLAKLTCDNCLPEEFDVVCGSSIVSVILSSYGAFQDTEVLTNIGVRVGSLLNGFANLEELELSEFIAEVSQLGPLWHHEKLRQLTMRDPCYAVLLLELVRSTPSLKILRINVLDWVDYDFGRLDPIPPCIVSQLEEVEFSGFECEAPQYNLLKFLLRNGEQLKKFIIINRFRLPLSPDQQTEVENYVSMFRIVDLVFQNI